MTRMCGKCRRLTEKEQCAFCGSTEIRVPGEDDYCFFTELDGPVSTAFALELNKGGIPFEMLSAKVGKKHVYHAIYVPYNRFAGAGKVLRALWKEGLRTGGGKA